MRHSSIQLATFVAASGVCAATAFAGPPAYYYRQLQSLPGGRTMASDLSESGLIAGSSGSYVPSQGPFAFVGDATGSVTNIDTMAFTTSSGNAINAAGQVIGVGRSSIGGSQWISFVVRHTPHQGMQLLGCLNPSTNGQIYATNSHGDAVGYWNVLPGSFLPHAIRHMDTTGLLDIHPQTAYSSNAVDTNDARQAVGSVTWTEGGFRSAALWESNGTFTDIGAILRSTMGASDSEAAFINNSGIVAGTVTINGKFRAFFWTQAGGATLVPVPAGTTWTSLDVLTESGAAFGTLSHGALFDETLYRFSLEDGRTDLGTIAPDMVCRVEDANDQGDLVGFAMDPKYETRPFLFTAAEGFFDLSTLTTEPIPWMQTRAFRINNAGQILVTGWDNQSIEVAALLSPIVTGDLNCDGAADILDINAFVVALSSEAAYAQYYPTCNVFNADVNLDGVVNVLDVNPFVALLGE